MRRSFAKPVMRSLCVMTVALPALSATSAVAGEPALPAPEKAVVLDVRFPWQPVHWGAGAAGPQARCATAEPRGRAMRFTVAQRGAIQTWTRYLTLPVDLGRYPIAVMRYRAVNTNPKGWWGSLWLDDTSGPGGGGVALAGLKDIIPDGRVHEISVDLGEVERKGPKQGPMIGMALSVASGIDGPATFDLLELRFEARPEAEAKPFGNDPKISVDVVDEDGRPLQGATVIVDAVRHNFARRAMTDATGRAVVVPPANVTHKHMVRVEMAGRVPVVKGDRKAPVAGQVQITLVPGTHYGGVVRDANRQPIKGARVGSRRRDEQGPNLSFDVLTDAAGRWTSPLLPADLPELPISISHPDFMDRSAQPKVDALRERVAVEVMQQGLALTGQVVDDDGRPIAGAVVQAGRSPWRGRFIVKLSDAQGRFSFTHLPAHTPWMVTVGAEGHALAMAQLAGSDELFPLVFQLQKAPPLRIRVVDEDGDPIPLAGVRLVSWLDIRYPLFRVQADDDGRVRWNSAPLTPFHAQIKCTGYEPQDGIRLKAREKEYTITLTRAE